MKSAAAVALAVLGLGACTSTVRDPSLRTPGPSPAARATGVAETMRRQVVNAADAGEGDIRVRELRRRLAVNPNDLAARLDLARLYEQAGFPDLALEHRRIAVARAPDSSDATIVLARSLNAQGLAAEAHAHLERYVGSNPDAPAEIWSWHGIVSDALGDYIAAERSHRSALRLREGSGPLHNNLGYNLLLQKRNSEAAAEFRRALEIDPGSAVARNNLGFALAGQPEEAVVAWKSVTDAASAHNNMAAVFIEQGDYQAARRELDLALAYRKDHPAALNNLQLLSTLDGGGLSLPGWHLDSSWRRFVRTLGVVLLGVESEEKPDTPAPGVSTQAAATGGPAN